MRNTHLCQKMSQSGCWKEFNHAQKRWDWPMKMIKKMRQGKMLKIQLFIFSPPSGWMVPNLFGMYISTYDVLRLQCCQKKTFEQLDSKKFNYKYKFGHRCCNDLYLTFSEQRAEKADLILHFHKIWRLISLGTLYSSY